MKGERLFVERQTELLEHLAEEKDITVKFKLAFLKCFSPLARDLEIVINSITHNFRVWGATEQKIHLRPL